MYNNIFTIRIIKEKIKETDTKNSKKKILKMVVKHEKSNNNNTINKS